MIEEAHGGEGRARVPANLDVVPGLHVDFVLAVVPGELGSLHRGNLRVALGTATSELNGRAVPLPLAPANLVEYIHLGAVDQQPPEGLQSLYVEIRLDARRPVVSHIARIRPTPGPKQRRRRPTTSARQNVVHKVQGQGKIWDRTPARAVLVHRPLCSNGSIAVSSAKQNRRSSASTASSKRRSEFPTLTPTSQTRMATLTTATEIIMRAVWTWGWMRMRMQRLIPTQGLEMSRLNKTTPMT